MATSEKQQAAPKMVTARVIRNYGSAIVGSTVRVPEAEYNRLREPDGAGGFRFPILISQADADALEVKKREVEAKARAAQVDTDRATSDGWAEYQRQSGQIVAAHRIEEQRRQQAILTGGDAKEDPEEQRHRFEQQVAAGRG